jgi:GYF domain 2
MHDIPTPPRWFLLRPPKRHPEGPFDLEELAALLRTGDISGETMTQREGDDAWIAFRERPEFETAVNEPPEAIEQHLQDEAAQEGEPWWTPQRLYYLGSIALPPFILIIYIWHRYPNVMAGSWSLLQEELRQLFGR